MKKLMMAAAIVCAAVGTQAAQFEWAFTTDDQMGDYTVASDAVYYLVSGDAGVGSTLAGILTDSATGGADAFTKALSGYNYQTGTLTGGSVPETSMYNVLKNYAALFIFNEDVVAGKAFAYSEYDVSEMIYTAPDSKTGLDAYASDWGDKDYAAAWGAGTIASVPEPTSGLLLLLGVAGMALRRRRA